MLRCKKCNCVLASRNYMNGFCDDCTDKKNKFKENFLDSLLCLTIAIPITIFAFIIFV